MDAAAAQPVTRAHDADVCVVGAGPAGLALAAQLARRGLAVVCVDPHGAWPARYSLWLDEARDLEVARWLSTTWPRTIVRTGSDVHELGRAYATLDNTRAREGLAALGGDRLVCVAARRTHVERGHTGGLVVSLDDGARVRCRLLLDASGASLASAAGPSASAAQAAQTAWGTMLDATATTGSACHEVLHGDAAVLMSFDGVLTGREAPSFVYALPLPGGAAFIEETCLASAPPLPIDALRARLHARLGGALAEAERCFIPLDATRTPGAFGAAAGLAHPCTGYSVATSWRLAPLVADALLATLAEHRGSDAALGARVTGAVDEVLWHKSRRRTRALHRLGLDLLLGLDGRSSAAFFATVFAAPPPVWRTFLDGNAEPDALLGAMSSIFHSLNHPLRRALSRLVLSRHLREAPTLVPALARAFFLGGAP